MSIGFIKVGNFKNGRHVPVNDFKTVQLHLKYIGFRSREIVPGQERFFNMTDNQADWKNFYQDVKNHKALQHSNTVKIHKLVFSLRESDYAAYQLSGRDYKEIIREVMKNYEQRKGIKIDWIASRHDRNDHPHCHVVMRAVSKEGSDGKSKRIYLSKEDVQLMKRDFDNEVARHRQIEHDNELHRDNNRTYLDRQFGHNSPSPNMMTLFNQFANAIEREQQKRAFEGERERQRKSRGKGR